MQKKRQQKSHGRVRAVEVNTKICLLQAVSAGSTQIQSSILRTTTRIHVVNCADENAKVPHVRIGAHLSATPAHVHRALQWASPLNAIVGSVHSNYGAVKVMMALVVVVSAERC